MLKYEEVKETALRNNFKIEELSETKNQKRLLRLTCPEGHSRTLPRGEFTSRFKGICAECSKNVPLTVETFLKDEKTKSRLQEGFLIKDVFRKNQEVVFSVTCSANHNYEIPRWRFNAGASCGTCTGKDKKETFRKLKESAKKEGWEILSENYEDQYQKLSFKNPEGIVFEMSADSWKRGHRSSRGSLVQVKDRKIEDVKKEFEAEGYQLLENQFISVKTKMKARCPLEHTFSVTYNHWKSSGVRCSVCNGTPAWTMEEILADPIYQQNGYKVKSTLTKKRKVHVILECEKGHELSPIQPSMFKARIARGLRCPTCYPMSSNAELDILEEIKKHYPDAQKKRIQGIEFDIFSESGKFAIEYCGLYFHSEALIDSSKEFACKITGKKRNKLIWYHSYKQQFLKQEYPEIKLFTIFEDEWLDKKEIVLNRILKKDRIYARDTLFKPIKQIESQEFLRKNHLQGAAPNSHTLCFGLFYLEELIGVIVFGSHPRQGHPEIVLSRLCFSKYHVLGGSEKLFKNSLPSLPSGKIISWSDNRYSEGDVYKRLGFTLEEELPPDYSYCKPGEFPIRVSKQSMKKTPQERLLHKTEHELRLEQGWFRIWDCGKKRWVYSRS